MFTTLDSTNGGRKRCGLAFISGLLLQILLTGAVCFLNLLFPQELNLTNKHYALAWLPDLMPNAKREVKPKSVRALVPKPKPLPALEFPALAVPKLEMPKIRPVNPPAIVHIPQPPVFAAAPSPPPEPIKVRTGLFGGAAEPVTTKRPLEQVQTGGFGSPQGFPGKAQGQDPGNVPKLGSFGLPSGPGVGNGTGGSKGIQGVVVSSGFGSGIAGSGDGRGRAETLRVATSGFGNVVPASQAPAAVLEVTTGGFQKARQETRTPAEGPQPAQPDFRPVEILSKPTPVYTEEARRSAIQGDVALSVVFEATGAVRVMGVVQSLGHGLDEAAEQAALKIRFTPAQRDGKPVDFPAILRIEFRLAEQSM